MAREGQGYPCCQHDMMMMILKNWLFVTSCSCGGISKYIHTHILIHEVTRGVMVITGGNGHDDASSNYGWGCLRFIKHKNILYIYIYIRARAHTYTRNEDTSKKGWAKSVNFCYNRDHLKLKIFTFFFSIESITQGFMRSTKSPTLPRFRFCLL